jgi:hypothetical protein
MIILPRQARDKRRENSKKRPFSHRRQWKSGAFLNVLIRQSGQCVLGVFGFLALYFTRAANNFCTTWEHIFGFSLCRFLTDPF